MTSWMPCAFWIQNRSYRLNPSPDQAIAPAGKELETLTPHCDLLVRTIRGRIDAVRTVGRCEADRIVRMPSEHGSDREHSRQGYAAATPKIL
jgi:hypothetical protein